MKKTRAFTLLIGLVVFVSLWPVAAQDDPTLTIFAAASLTDAFIEIAEAFKAENPGLEIIFNFGSSSTLATQLAEGAPADIFASANNRQMTVAVDAGRIAADPLVFTQNRLILIVPADNPANIQSLRDLANQGVVLIVAAPGAPIRDYTDTMLEQLAAEPEYGEAYRAAVIANIVSEEETVRQVTAKVALGEADAGVVYSSDVTPDIAAQVIALPVPGEFNTIASYPIGITDDSPNPELAQRFIDYLLSSAGQEILAAWNFIPVCSPQPDVTPEAEPESTPEAEATPPPTPEDAYPVICP